MYRVLLKLRHNGAPHRRETAKGAINNCRSPVWFCGTHLRRESKLSPGNLPAVCKPIKFISSRFQMYFPERYIIRENLNCILLPAWLDVTLQCRRVLHRHTAVWNPQRYQKQIKKERGAGYSSDDIIGTRHQRSYDSSAWQRALKMGLLKNNELRGLSVS